ncbi:MAG: hypothetical protein AB7O66_11595 [Limisphaerales bacterium]
MLPLPSGFRKRLCANAGVEICSDDERKTLHDIEQRWRQVSEVLGALCQVRERPGRAARRELEQALEQMTTGDSTGILTMNCWTRNELIEESTTKIGGVKRYLRRIASEALPLLEEIAARHGELAEAMADKVNEAETETCRAWGLPERPHPVARALRQFAWQVVEGLPSANTIAVPPSHLLPEAFEQAASK